MCGIFRMKIIAIILITSILAYNNNLDTYKLTCKDGIDHEYFFKPDSSGSYKCLVHFTDEEIKIIKGKL